MQSTSSSPRHGRLALFVAGFFQLQLEDLPRIALMFLYSLLAVGGFIVGRILQDALLLTLPKSQGKDMILTLIGLAAIIVSTSTYIYSKFAHTLRRDEMIIKVNIVLACGTLLIYSLLVAVPQPLQFLVIYLNYVFVEVMGSLQVILFWTLASELFNPRAAKRSFAIIGGGAVLANLLAFAVRPMVLLLGGAHHLLVLLVAMLVCCVWVVRRIGTQNEAQLEHLFTQKQHQVKTSRKQKSDQQIDMGADSERIWSNRHLATIAMVIFVTFAVSTMINYLFKSVNADAFHNDRNGLANFLSMFYGCSGVLACVVQFGLANRVLRHAGIRVALLLLPLAMLGGATALAMSASALAVFWASTMTKGSENVLRYTIYDVSLNLLYVPVDSRLRARAKAFIDGILKPSSIALAALVCAGLSYAGWDEREFSFLLVAMLVLWVGLIFRAHREYIATLVRSMQTRRLDLNESQFAIQDESAFQALRGVLATGDTQQVLHALELLPHVPNMQWQKDLLGLLSRDDPQVQVASLRLLSRLDRPMLVRDGTLSRAEEELLRENQALEHRLYTLIGEGGEEVRAQAIETLCSLRQEEAVADVMPYLQDADPEVQAAAIVGLVSHTGLDGMLYAAEHLRRLLEHEEAESRRIGAQIVGRLGSETFYRPLLLLLEDEDKSVRLAAIQSAGALCAPQLIDGLIKALNEPGVGMEAARALVLFGEDILPRLQPLFMVHDAPLQQLGAVRVCRELGTQSALSALDPALSAPKRGTRVAAYKAIQRIVRREPQLKPTRELLRPLLFAKLQHHQRWGARRTILERELRHSSALNDAIDERLEETMEEIFLLLDLLYPGQQCSLIYHHLSAGEPRLRANAIELLDNFVEQDVKRSLLPMLEHEYMSLDMQQSGTPAPTLEQALERIAEDASVWMQTALLWSIGLNRLTHWRPFVEQAANHDAPIIRETAYVAMKGILPRGDYRAALEQGSQDHAPQVARYVKYQLAQLDALSVTGLTSTPMSA